MPDINLTRRWRRIGVSLGSFALAASVLSACGGGASPSSKSGASLTVYSGQHVQTTEALVTKFEAETGIHVALRSNDEAVLDDQIVAEGSRSPADVIFTENSPVLENLEQRGLLAPVDASTLAATPSRFNSPGGDWVGVSARVSVMVYNPRLIAKSALPAHVIDLAEAKYKGKVALAPGETDFQPIVTSVARTYGQAEALRWLAGLKTNAGSHTYPDNESVVNEVNRGVVAVGVINQYYWYRMRAEIGAASTHSAIAYFAPRDPGYVLDVSGAGVLRTSKHKSEAQRFLAFLVSRTGQEIIAHSISYEYPIASGVTSAQPETPFVELAPNAISIPELGTGATAIALLDKVQLL